MKQIIKVKPEIRVELTKEFPVSEKTVYNALNFLTGGYAAEQIRRRALELGGKLMQEVVGGTEGTMEDIVKCLCCKHCLPPAERIDGRMCNESECAYEET